MPIGLRPTGLSKTTGGRISCYPSPGDFYPPLLREGVAAESFYDRSVNRGDRPPLGCDELFVGEVRHESRWYCWPNRYLQSSPKYSKQVLRIRVKPST